VTGRTLTGSHFQVVHDLAERPGARRVILDPRKCRGGFCRIRRALNTLVGRLAILQLLIYALLPPVLFYGLDAAARTNALNTLTRHSRAYTSSQRRSCGAQSKRSECIERSLRGLDIEIQRPVANRF
jgi:hypothetical protein